MHDLDTIHRMNGETEKNAAEAAQALTEAEIKAAADTERTQDEIDSGRHGQLTIGDIMRPVEWPDDSRFPHGKAIADAERANE